MVKITNGLTTIEVTVGAFKSIYQYQGYELVDPSTEGAEEQTIEVTVGAGEDEKDQTPSEDTDTEDGKDTNDGNDDPSEGDQNASENGNGEDKQTDPFAELITKPVSQWSKEEMQGYVKANDIDTSKAKNVSEAKKIIAEYIDSIQ